MKLRIHLFGLILFFSPMVLAEDAKSIMKQVIDRNDGTTEVSQMVLSTCSYLKKGKRVVCKKSPRVKKMILVRKDYGINEKDHKSVTILLDPPGERGIGFLQYDYEDLEKESDQWLYLSAMKKVKRIVSGNDNEPKSGSFFGSEFSYEDLESFKLSEYTYTILKEENYSKHPCWVIESTPTPLRQPKSNYSKTVDWVDKARMLVLKSKRYNRKGKLMKIVYFRDIKRIDGIDVSEKIIVNNVENQRRTILTIERISLNVPIKDDFLTLRTLTDGAFRWKNLKTYQAHLTESP